jgi:hypothetical protein
MAGTGKEGCGVMTWAEEDEMKQDKPGEGTRL